jgi:myosin heavy subunit
LAIKITLQVNRLPSFQDEYEAEGISWSNVNYVDNSSCLDLIHAKPTGLFQLLDEESG